jgi:general stress protein YciG
MKAKTAKEKLDAYNRIIEGAKKGGSVKGKKFTKESKQRQVNGGRKGGLSTQAKKKLNINELTEV